MTERIQKPDTGSLPDINIFFPVLVKTAPSGASTSNPLKYLYVQIHDFFSSQENQISQEFPEEGLDSLYKFWGSFGITELHVKRLVDAAHDPLIPDIESAEAKKLADRKNELISSFTTSVYEFIKQGYKEWELVNKAIQMASDFERESDIPMEEQIIALCEAISIVFAENQTDPKLMRQMIAQHALTELFEEGIPYAAYYLNTKYPDPTNMRDYLEIEKDELTYAIRHGIWDEKTLAEKERFYKQLINGLYRNHGYSAADDVILGLKLLWKCAKGELLKKTSAIKILRVQNEVFETLQADEVFDIELSDDEIDLE